MKRNIRLLLLPTFFMLVLGSTNAFSQCKGFAKNICKDELGSYTHDGNYHAAILTEGEEADTITVDENYPGPKDSDVQDTEKPGIKGHEDVDHGES